MNWILICNGAHNGQFNMEFDLKLADECSDNTAYLRFYQWLPYAISLGANQLFNDINLVKAANDNIDVVKRPTGGRAVLHAEELTYSVIIPTASGLTPHEIYNKISLALVRGLIKYDSNLKNIKLENRQPDFSSLLKNPFGVICFASTAKHEVKYNGKKLVGSAQRRFKKVTLQHGSILVGAFHRYLLDYLNCDEKTKTELKQKMIDKTIELETILKRKVDYSQLIDSLVKGFEDEWEIKFVDQIKKK